MTCNPTTILLSSSGATTINVTLSTDPGDGSGAHFADAAVDSLFLMRKNRAGSGS